MTNEPSRSKRNVVSDGGCGDDNDKNAKKCKPL